MHGWAAKPSRIESSLQMLSWLSQGRQGTGEIGFVEPLVLIVQCDLQGCGSASGEFYQEDTLVLFWLNLASGKVDMILSPLERLMLL